MPEDVLDSSGLFTDEAGHARCYWCRASPLYRHYHDHQWGFPVVDEGRLFEKLCLEGFQAGLSWLTILNKREAFRAAMANFEAEELARFGPADVERLLGNAAIVRHRGKIESAIHNARRVLELRGEYGSLAAYVWRHAPQAGEGRQVAARLFRRCASGRGQGRPGEHGAEEGRPQQPSPSQAPLRRDRHGHPSELYRRRT